jgi:two-component system copper resistance phosphate regulon response regulator CusR
MRILVAEDEFALLDIIVHKLKQLGYGVDGCSDGREAVDFLDTYEYDVIILDITMPKLDGLQVIRHARSRKIETPILCLTARDSIEDREKGLDAGADDYLTKPFSFDEIYARLRALLRRQKATLGSILIVSDLTMDSGTMKVHRGSDLIDLTAKEYAILEYFMRNPDIVLTRLQIAEHVWSSTYDNDSNVVDVYIRYLRRKIDEPYKNKLIHTIRGAGYVLKDSDL